MAEREYERDDAGKFSGVGGGVARKQHEALAQSTFNPTFAPPNWNTQKHDSPDYFTMRL